MIFPENRVVQILLNNSCKFKNYYDSERSKIKSQITWERKNDLPKGISFRTTQINNTHFIYLRRIPPLIDDATRIAHELQHVLHKDQGVSSLGVRDVRFNNLCSSINSCIHDLLVNKDLIEFDFDLCSDYVKERNESKLQLARFAHEPNNKLDILHWAFNYTSSKLDFDFIKSMYEFEDDSYFIWFEERYPKTTEISEKIKTVIENIGIDSNDKVKRVLITLVDEFKLGNIMLI